MIGALRTKRVRTPQTAVPSAPTDYRLPITDNFFDHIGTASGLGFESPFAILDFQSDAVISGNLITYCGGGIGSNYLDGDESHGPRLTITGASRLLIFDD